MSENKSIARATLAGTIWVYTSFIVGKGLAFVVNVILARLLLPEDFGLLALGLLVINYIDTISDFGVSSALVYRQEDPERTRNNAFVITIGSGILLTALAFFAAPYVAIFFRDDRVTSVMRALSLAVLISSFGSTHSSILRKNLDFRRRFIPDFARSLVKGLVSIVLALMGFGVWSLVWGHVVSWVVNSLLYWLMVRDWHPTWNFDWAGARQMIGYGVQIVFINLFGQLINNLDYVFIGRRMDVAQLGFYTIAFRIPELVILNICNVVSQAIFPAYAKLQNDARALQKGWLTTLQYVSLITVPAGIGMAVVASEFVHVFYTDRWSPAIPVMQFLALYAVLYSLAFNSGDVYKATGRPVVLNQIAVVRLMLMVPMLWYASSISIVAVGAGTMLINLIITPLQLHIASRILKVSWGKVFEALAPAFISTAVMLGAMLALRLALVNVEPIVRLILLIATGAGVYALTLWVTHRDLLERMAELVLSVFRKRRAAVPEA